MKVFCIDYWKYKTVHRRSPSILIAILRVTAKIRTWYLPRVRQACQSYGRYRENWWQERPLTLRHGLKKWFWGLQCNKKKYSLPCSILSGKSFSDSMQQITIYNLFSQNQFHWFDSLFLEMHVAPMDIRLENVKLYPMY